SGRADALGCQIEHRAGAGTHRAVVLRTQGRHRRPGLRPVAQPLQGDRPRRGRAPAAAGDHRRHREAGGRDCCWAGGAEGDAVVSWPVVQLGEVCEFKYGKSLAAARRDGGKYSVYGSNGKVGWHSVSLTTGPTIVIGRKGSFGEVTYS